MASLEDEEGVVIYQPVEERGMGVSPMRFSRETRAGRPCHGAISTGCCADAAVLGDDTIVGTNSVIGASVSLTKSVPPNTLVTIEKPSLKFRGAT